MKLGRSATRIECCQSDPSRTWRNGLTGASPRAIGCMIGPALVDTAVIVCRHTAREPAKQARANDLHKFR